MTDAERTQFIARTPAAAGRAAPRPRPTSTTSATSRRTGWIWAAVVVALLLVIGVGSFVLFGSGGGIGQEERRGRRRSSASCRRAAAIAAASAQGLVPRARDRRRAAPCADNQTVDEGQVCVTKPAAGDPGKEGTVVVYQVFQPTAGHGALRRGQELRRRGERSCSAASLHRRAQGRAQRRQEGHRREAGHRAVHAQVKPGTKVTLEVSTGTIELPDVTGKTQDDAESTHLPASSRNVKTQKKTTADQSKDGMVAAREPGAGHAYPPEQQITLTSSTTSSRRPPARPRRRRRARARRPTAPPHRHPDHRPPASTSSSGSATARACK